MTEREKKIGATGIESSSMRKFANECFRFSMNVNGNFHFKKDFDL